jgi:hypothetical protein
LLLHRVSQNQARTVFDPDNAHSLIRARLAQHAGAAFAPWFTPTRTRSFVMSAIQEKVVLITGAQAAESARRPRGCSRGVAPSVVLGARRTDQARSIGGRNQRRPAATASFQRLDVTHRPDVEAFAEFALRHARSASTCS